MKLANSFFGAFNYLRVVHAYLGSLYTCGSFTSKILFGAAVLKKLKFIGVETPREHSRNITFYLKFRFRLKDIYILRATDRMFSNQTMQCTAGGYQFSRKTCVCAVMKVFIVKISAS